MQDEIQQLIEQIEQLHKEGKFQEIVDLLPYDLLQEKGSAILYAWKGRAYNNLNNSDWAEELANKALAIDADCALAYLVKGNIWCDRKEYDKAIVDYSAAIEKEPEEADAYYNRGGIWYDRKEYDKAIADYSKAIEKEHDFSLAFLNRGLTWFFKKEYDKALADYNAAIVINPNSSQAYNNRGVIKYEKEEYSIAIEDYTKAIELKHDPLWRPLMNRSNCYKALADVARDKEDFVGALEFIRKALNDIDEARINKGDEKDFLENDRKNLLDLRKLIYEALNSQATIKQVNEMKAEVDAAKKKINDQASETLAAFNEVEKLRDRMREQAEQFDVLAKNVKEVETKFAQEQIEIKALESFFETSLKDFETKLTKAETDVLIKNIVLMVASVLCIGGIIVYLIWGEHSLAEDKALMIYFISLTAITLAPFIWMLKLAIKKRNEMLILSTEYRHKTALASSLYSFKLTLGDMYTKETTAQTFNTIYGQSPCELLADDKSVRMKNNKEQDYPHVTLEIIQKTLPEVVEKVVKAVLSKKEDKE